MKLISITEVKGLYTSPTVGGVRRVGIAEAISLACGGGLSYDGYEIKTESHRWLALITNGQS